MNNPRPRNVFAPWLALLAISVLINYIDRGNLSLAAPLLKNELQLSPWQLGILFSAFFWTYTALQFVMGWVVDRFEVNLVIAAGYLVWSLATAVTGLVHGFLLLLLMRLMLGVGESVAFPSCSKILARHVSEQNRGFANGAVSAGMKLGPALGTLGRRIVDAAVRLAAGTLSASELSACCGCPRGRNGCLAAQDLQRRIKPQFQL